MKTLFTMGFASQRNFWMAQASGPVTAGGMDYAMGLYKQVQDWLAKTPNPGLYLGNSLAQFQNSKATADNLYADVSGFTEILDTGGTLSDDQNKESNQFYDAITIAWGLIVQNPNPISQTAATPPAAQTQGPTAQQTTQAITSAAQTIAKAVGPKTPTPTPAKPTVAPPPAPATDYTTPLIIGGGALAVVIALVAASR